MNRKIRKTAYVLLSGLIVIIVYIFFHELGHTIVMLSAGAKITEFSILTAHVSATGGNYTDLSDLWLHANGIFFPIVVSFVYSLFYQKNCINSFYRIFSYMVVLAPTCSLLAWVIIPFAYLQGNAPVGDDVTHFLDNFSQISHPLIVSAVAAIIIGISIFVMGKKRIIQNFIAEVKGG